MLSAFTDLVGPASFPDTRLGRKWITGSVYKSRTPWMSTIILKANSVITGSYHVDLPTFCQTKKSEERWVENKILAASPSWKTLLSSAQAPSRLDESEVTSVKHRSVKYFENISSRIESDSKAAESLRSRPWTHGRSAVGIVLSVPRVSCGNRVWLPSSERLGSYDIIIYHNDITVMILLIVLLYIIAHHCTPFFHTWHKWSRAFQGTLPAQRLQRCRWLSLATPPPGHKLWWNMMKIRPFLRNWNDELIINSKNFVKLALKVEGTLGTLQLVLICGIHLD